jgi:RNA polymerase sigma-70 factor (ECF subfamily)
LAPSYCGKQVQNAVQAKTEHKGTSGGLVDDQPADASTMQAIANGDESAFAQLLDRHIHRVHHFVLRITNRPGDADDLVQETFLRVWRNAGQFSQQRASLTTWLMSIARNLCIDEHRRSNTRPTGHSVADGQTVLDALADEPSGIVSREDSGGHAVLQLEQARRLEYLRAAIADLPERQRTAITLCQLQGYSNANAAEILNIKVAAVESLLARARRTLRAALSTTDLVNET